MPVRPSREPRPRKPNGYIGPLPYSERSDIAHVFKKSPSHEARIFVVRQEKRRRIIFRTEWDQRLVISTYVMQKLFNALYPENSLRPLSIEFQTVDGKKVLGMTSEIVHGRSNDYKRFSESFYGEGHSPHDSHIKFASSAGKVAGKMVHESGIVPASNPINTMNSNGRPIFVEIAYVQDREKLVEALKSKGVDVNRLREEAIHHAPSELQNEVRRTWYNVLQ